MALSRIDSFLNVLCSIWWKACPCFSKWYISPLGVHDLVLRSHIAHLGCHFWGVGREISVNQGFSALARLTFGPRWFLIVQFVLDTVGRFSSTRHLHLLDASSSPPVVMNKDVSRCWQMPPRGESHSWLRATALNRYGCEQECNMYRNI